MLDEATSALDPESQEMLMNLINEKIPDATVISVGHRPELEDYHERKLVLKHQTGGARIIGDEYLTFIPGPRAKLFRRVLDWRGDGVVGRKSWWLSPARTRPLDAGRLVANGPKS